MASTTEHWNWDTWTGEEREEDYDGEEHSAASGPHCDDEGFNVSFNQSAVSTASGCLSGLHKSLSVQMDADFDPSQQQQQQLSKKKKKKERKKMKKEDLPQMGKKKKKSHFAEVVTKSKPVFDPRKCQKSPCSHTVGCWCVTVGCSGFRGEELRAILGRVL